MDKWIILDDPYTPEELSPCDRERISSWWVTVLKGHDAAENI